MRLTIDDGYTLKGETREDWSDGRKSFSGLPVVAYSYRPAMPEAIYEWEYKMRFAGSGQAELQHTVEFLMEHLTGWDVQDAGGRMAPLTREAVKKVPVPILMQILNTVCTWAPRQKEKDAGNSSGASA